MSDIKYIMCCGLCGSKNVSLIQLGVQLHVYIKCHELECGGIS